MRLPQERIQELRKTLHRDVAGGREVLRQILDGPIRFTLDGSDYRLEGRTRVGALFNPDSSVTSIRLASPRGLGPCKLPTIQVHGEAA